MWLLEVNLLDSYRTCDWGWWRVRCLFWAHSLIPSHQIMLQQISRMKLKSVKKERKKKRLKGSWHKKMSVLTVTWTVTAIIHSSACPPQGAAHSNAAVDVCTITNALSFYNRSISHCQAGPLPSHRERLKLPGWTLFVYECTAGTCRKFWLYRSMFKISSSQISQAWTTMEGGFFLYSDYFKTKMFVFKHTFATQFWVKNKNSWTLSFNKDSVPSPHCLPLCTQKCILLHFFVFLLVGCV